MSRFFLDDHVLAYPLRHGFSLEPRVHSYRLTS